MKLSQLLSVTLIALFATNAASATQLPNPDKCPEVYAIQQAGLDRIHLFSDHTWTASNKRNMYDTNFYWTFVLGSDGEQVENEENARQKALREMETLTFAGGPFYDEAGNTASLYNSSKIKNALAITPPLNLSLSFRQTNIMLPER